MNMITAVLFFLTLLRIKKTTQAPASHIRGGEGKCKNLNKKT